MAENLLHTHSGYAKHYIDKNFLNSIGAGKGSVEAKIQRVEDKEKALYKKFNADNYFQFKEKIMELFDPSDRKVMQNFEATKLRDKLAIYASQHADLYGQEVELRFDFKQLENLQKNGGFKDFQKSTKIDLSVPIRINYNTSNIKSVINKAFGRKFHTGKEYSRGVDSAVHSLITSGVLSIGLGKPNSRGELEYNETYETHIIPNFPWGVTVEEYRLAQKEQNFIFLREIDKAVEEIKRFIVQELGGEKGCSTEMQTAIERAWNNLIGLGNDPAVFFSGGTKNNFMSGVQGALGEFQSALIFEYIQLKTGLSTLPTIVGNTSIEKTITKEQGKTDVQIFESIGLQVKNFVVIEDSERARTVRDIETNQHPKKFARYLDENTATHFLGFLANFYFNTSYRNAMEGRMNQLEYRLSYWLAELMNMAIIDSEKDTVSFYVIGGQYMVPCSALLRASKELGLEHNIEITSSYKGFSDLEYARHSTKPDKSGKGSKKLYNLYWTKEENGWRHTDKNEEEFENLINSRIAIRTHFNLLKDIKNYALW